MNVKLKILHKSGKQSAPSLCAGCSAAIPPDATFCEHCHAPIVRKYCVGCSRLIPDNSVNCPYCGTSGKIKPRERNFQWPNLWILVVLGITGAYFFWDGFSASKKATQVKPTSEQSRQAVPPPPTLETLPPKESPTVQISNPKPIFQSDEEGTRLNLQGYTLIQNGDYQNAEAVLRRAVQAFPQGTRAIAYKFALYNLGHVLRKNGRPKEAVTYLEKAANIDPEWSKAQSELAVARQEAANSKVL
jgi:tetratricopeptide (TPR) repeat protein/RNA polymerase subunit RPABC4/transcription elongation factor Spt4